MFKFVYGRDWIGKAFLALIAFSFVIGTAIMWGPGGLNFGFGNYAVKVGDITVTPKELMLEIYRLQNQYPNLPKDKLKRAAVNNLVLTALFAYLAHRDGFYVSDQEIKEFIKTQFSQNGTFNPQLFENYLKAIKMTPKEFEESLRKTLLATKYKKAVYATSYANDKTLEALLLPYTLKLEVKVKILSYKNFEKLFNPSEEELRNFYNKIAKNFAEKVPARVEIYTFDNEEELKKAYQLLKEGKSLNLKPTLELEEENLKELKEEKIKELAQKVFENKNIAVEKIKGKYILGVYRPPSQRTPTYGEVKNKVLEIYRQAKALEYLQEHKETLTKEVEAGKYQVSEQKGTLAAYELMKKFNLTAEDLIGILGGKKVLSAIIPQGLAVIEIEKVEKNQELGEGITKYFRLSVRNEDYLRKLQGVIKYVIEHQEVEVKVNRNLLERL